MLWKAFDASRHSHALRVRDPSLYGTYLPNTDLTFRAHIGPGRIRRVFAGSRYLGACRGHRTFSEAAAAVDRTEPTQGWMACGEVLL